MGKGKLIDRTGYEDKNIRILGRAKQANPRNWYAAWWYECKHCCAIGVCRFQPRPYGAKPYGVKGKVCACSGGHAKIVIPFGAKSGFLTMLRRTEDGKVVCGCVCGRIVICYSHSFRNKTTRSCGCKCHALYSDSIKRELTCKNCSKIFIAKVAAVFCSRNCGLRYRRTTQGPLERLCKECHQPFLSIRSNHVYCSLRCGHRVKDRKVAERKALQQMIQLNQLLEKSNVE